MDAFTTPSEVALRISHGNVVAAKALRPSLLFGHMCGGAVEIH